MIAFETELGNEDPFGTIYRSEQVWITKEYPAIILYETETTKVAYRKYNDSLTLIVMHNNTLRTKHLPYEHFMLSKEPLKETAMRYADMLIKRIDYEQRRDMKDCPSL